MTNNIPAITLDGPSGSGKGTISQLLAEKLQWHFLDSGALYRVLAYGAMKREIAITDVAALADLAENLAIEFKVAAIGQTPLVFFEDEDVSTAIRTEACGETASKIAAHPAVRKALLQWQRDFCKPPGLVADGRDMGTVVFPEAQVKFFLTASLDERARRRYKQLKQKGMNVTLESVLDELAQRDVRDKERAVSPMIPAKDAIIIDTTGLSIEDVLGKVLSRVE